MSAHTPTPWFLGGNGAVFKNGRREVYYLDGPGGKHGRKIALIIADGFNNSEYAANARFIVRACNGWYDSDALRARLKELED